MTKTLQSENNNIIYIHNQFFGNSAVFATFKRRETEGRQRSAVHFSENPTDSSFFLSYCDKVVTCKRNFRMLFRYSLVEGFQIFFENQAHQRTFQETKMLWAYIVVILQSNSELEFIS